MPKCMFFTLGIGVNWGDQLVLLVLASHFSCVTYVVVWQIAAQFDKIMFFFVWI